MEHRLGLLGIGLLAALPLVGGCFGQSGSGGTAPIFDSGLTTTYEASFGGDSATDGSTSVGAGSVIDFGLVDCGGQAPAAKTFSITNGGSTPIHYSLSLSATTIFQIVGGTAADVAPGAVATITVATTAVPTSATAGQVDQAMLTVVTDDPKLPSTLVTLKRTAQGATLTLAPATIAFGDVSVSSASQPTMLTLTNAGNETASVTLGAPSDPQFALTWTGAAGTPVSLAPMASVPMLSATFSPTASGPASASSTLTLTGAVCGVSASSLALSGNGTKGSVAVNPGALDFQSVDCGQTAAAQSVKVTNSGNAAFNFKAALAAGATSPFTVAPASGPVAPGTSVTVTVTPKAIPGVASVAANAFGDVLQITSDVVGDGSHDVPLTQTAQGAVLALDTTSIPFGDVSVAQTKTSPFNITNTGTLPATVSLTVSGAGFAAVPTTPTALTVGGSAIAGTASFTPTAVGSQAGSIAIATGATDVVCSAPIGPIAMNGNGTNGTLSVSTSALDFQSVPCKQTAAPQSFTLGNSGTASFTWTATLGKGAASPYTLSTSSGTLAPGATPATVTVTPAAIPFPSALTADLYGDTLTITPSGIAGGSPQTITLSETASGAIITVAPTPFPAFANQQELQASAAATLTITNTGTMPVTLTPTIAGTNASSFLLATPGAKALAINGGTYSPGPTFKPQTTGPLSAQVNLAVGANDVLCQPLPAAVALSGTGTNGSITLGATSLAIAAQPCGATAGLTQTLKLSNNGTAPLTFTAAIAGTTGFSVSPTTGSIAANASASLTVTGPTFTSTRGNVTAVTDTLQVTTTAVGDVVHDVALSSTPSGAILAWGPGLTGFAFGTVQATTGGTKGKSLPLSVTNNGNTAATVSFALAGTTPFTFSPQDTAVAGNGGTLSGSATFDPTSSSGQSDTVNLTVPAGTNLCGALPAGLSITGTGAQGTLTLATKGLGFTLTCNTQAASQTFNLNNGGTEPYDFTASISGTGWSVTPTSGTVTAGTPFTITVKPPAVGAGTPGTANNATLSMTTDIPGDFVHTLQMGGTLTGATFAFVTANGAAEPTLAWGSRVSGTGTATTVLSNTGNASATISASVTPDANNITGSGLIIDSLSSGSWSTTAATGGTTLTYGLSDPNDKTCGPTLIFTVTIPSTLPGVCGGATQTLTILDGGHC